MSKERKFPEILLNDPLLDCFGIQPIFTQDGEIVENNVFHVYRELITKRNKLGYFKFNKLEDYKKLQLGAFHYSLLWHRVIEEMLKCERVFGLGCTVDKFLEYPKEKCLDLIKLQAYYLWYINTFRIGNRFISSNEKLLKYISFKRTELHHEKILVSSELLKDNVLIVAAKGTMMSDQGLVLCPFIDKDEYLEYLDINGLSDDIPVDRTERYPLLKKWSKIYSHYESFIKEKTPKKWYISRSLDVGKFYSIIVFNES